MCYVSQCHSGLQHLLGDCLQLLLQLIAFQLCLYNAVQSEEGQLYLNQALCHQRAVTASFLGDDDCSLEQDHVT